MGKKLNYIQRKLRTFELKKKNSPDIDFLGNFMPYKNA